MNNRLLTIILALLVELGCIAQDSAESQQDIRINPNIEVGGAHISTPDYAFIKTDANKIQLNGDDWSALAIDIDTAQLFSIVHIGDSHIQADFATSRVRKHLQSVYGSAGRGLIVPFKLAGTNQPLDYKITSTSDITSSVLLKQPWRTDMSFTGIAIQSPGGKLELNVKTDTEFNTLKVYYKGDAMKADSLDYKIEDKGVMSIALQEYAMEQHITLLGNAVVSGVSLLNGQRGVCYHAIGNNGATYSTYSLIDDFAEGVAQLSPQLIIISLGTNEAFGSITAATFRLNIDRLVTSLRKQNPKAKLLLVTPSECQRKKITRTKVRRKRYKTTTTYVANTKVKELRNVILDYAKQNGVAVYDWYDIAGGDGSSTKWINNDLFSKDRIHHSVAGYQLQGDLFAKALLQMLKKEN